MWGKHDVQWIINGKLTKGRANGICETDGFTVSLLGLPLRGRLVVLLLRGSTGLEPQDRQRELLRGSSELLQVFYCCRSVQRDLSSGRGQMGKAREGNRQHSSEESRSYLSLCFLSVT